MASDLQSESSSESDDEFLVVGHKGRGIGDRETLIREKLLESFYGQSRASRCSETGGNFDGANLSVGDRGKDLLESFDARNAPGNRGNDADASGLDSAHFEAASHVSRQVLNCPIHKLFEIDEQLTANVRTLDSTTQNMVYDNYSKFIDATEAVKSVGIHVQSNHQGLESLRHGMEAIIGRSSVVETDLGALRDAVAEKIRVKRLLTKLDALLKLPATLQEQVDSGAYLKAGRSFCRSTSILSKHSAGFDSLLRIEAKCQMIVENMLKDLNRKCRYWSGQALYDVDFSLDTIGGDEFPPNAPGSISEIFECTGTLALLARQELDVGLAVESCMSISLSASARFMDRLLDNHQSEIQDSIFNSTTSPGTSDKDKDIAPFQADHGKRGQLVPSWVIGKILETATLFRMHFAECQQHPGEKDMLEAFAKEAYSSFLLHVRSVLLDHGFGSQRSEDSSATDEDDGQEGDGDEVYEDVAGGLSELLLAVRELASGLSLPEIGISAEITARFVEQASDLTEALVRGRVDHKFCDLRLRVVRDCLVPFANRVAEGPEPNEEWATAEERSHMLQAVQIAVSDCLQLLDDAVRSIVSGRKVLGSSALSVDHQPVLKESIHASMRRFASWLAGTLEMLAGCVSSDRKLSFEASREKLTDEANSTMEELVLVASATAKSRQENVSVLSRQHDSPIDRIDSVVQDLIAELDAKGKNFRFALAVCRICRGCEQAFVGSIKQSIESNFGGGKGKCRSGGLFPMENSKRNTAISEQDRKITGRYALAVFRILTMSATHRGFVAARSFGIGLDVYSGYEGVPVPQYPSPGICCVLQEAKQLCFESADFFNDSLQFGPVPSFSTPSDGVSQPLLGHISSPLKGLQLDVERAFHEKISIYPHPSRPLPLSRDAVATIMFKVVVKAIAEQTREHVFSPNGYSQLVVDLELLRGMLSHYIDSQFQDRGVGTCSLLSGLVTDALNSAGERCKSDCGESEVSMALSSLHDFMKSNPGPSSFIFEQN